MSVIAENGGDRSTVRGDAAKTPDPDLEVLQKSREGDRDAYEELVRRHQKRVFNVAYRILGDYDEAQDIAQDAFLQAYRSLKGFRGESRFSHWLLTITANLCRNRIKYWKRRERRKTFSIDEPIRREDSEMKFELPDPAPSTLDKVEGREAARIMEEEMSSLSEEYRTVIVFRELQQLSYEEIGTILGIAPGTVKSRLHRGRSELRDRLKERLGADGTGKGAAPSRGDRG